MPVPSIWPVADVVVKKTVTMPTTGIISTAVTTRGAESTTVATDEVLPITVSTSGVESTTAATSGVASTTVSTSEFVSKTVTTIRDVCTAVATQEPVLKDCDAPDGGWGWVVTIACFILLFLLAIPCLSFGILFSPFLMELGTSSTVTAWIYNLALVITGLVTYMIGPLVEEFGWRNVCFAFSVVFGTGMILSAFATSAGFLFFSFSVLVGVTLDILVNTCWMIIPHYFTRWRNIANSIMASGFSVSQLAMPPVITILQEEFGFKGATLIIGALVLNCCVAAMILHPVEWHTNKSYTCFITLDQEKESEVKTGTSKLAECLKRVIKTAIYNLQFLKSFPVVLVTLVLTIHIVVLRNVFTLAPFAMHEAGFSQREASLCLSAAGGFNLAARLLSGFLACCPAVRATPVFLSGAIISSLATIGFSLVGSLTLKAVSLGLCGGGYGICVSQCNLIIVDELGFSMLSPGFSILGLFSGILSLFLGPVTGVVRDVSESYVVSLCFCGGCLLLNVLLALLLPVTKALQRHRHQQRKHQQKLHDTNQSLNSNHFHNRSHPHNTRRSFNTSRSHNTSHSHTISNSHNTSHSHQNQQHSHLQLCHQCKHFPNQQHIHLKEHQQHKNNPQQHLNYLQEQQQHINSLQQHHNHRQKKQLQKKHIQKHEPCDNQHVYHNPTGNERQSLISLSSMSKDVNYLAINTCRE